MVMVTEFMDLMLSYITDCLQNVESSIFEDFWSEDKDFYGPRGQGHSWRTTTLQTGYY